MIFQFLSSISP